MTGKCALWLLLVLVVVVNVIVESDFCDECERKRATFEPDRTQRYTTIIGLSLAGGDEQTLKGIDELVVPLSLAVAATAFRL